MANTAPPRPALLTLANALTFSRLVLLPLVIAGVATRHGFLAAGAMLAIWITDLLDGRLARRMGQASAFGKSLDSTIDFVLIYSLFIAFYAAGRLATWQFAFLYLSMLAILLLQFAQAATGGELAATSLGKVTGSLQYLYLLFLVAREVLPGGRAMAIANLSLFGALAAAIVLNAAECAVRVRRIVRAAGAGTAGD
jgi:CDP-diacylglycerol--glycerol-3-phosphate 3-phosphatidyltransferase